MKNHFIFSFFTLLTLAVVIGFTSSCDDDASGLGQSIKDKEELIDVNYDSVIVESRTVKLDSIISKNSSFKLGVFTDKTFGTTQADFLSELYYPYNISFPENVEKLDSAKIVIYYDSWFGDSTALQNVKIYQLSKNLDKDKQYYSNVDVSKYCDKNVLLGEKSFSAANHTIPDSLQFYSYLNHSIEIPIDATIYNSFFNDFKNGVWDASNLNDYLKGIYVTTDYGNGCILNVRKVSINMYYKSLSEDGEITNLYQTLTTSKEVKSVNHIVHDDLDDYIELNNNDSVNYLASPANLYTEITIPSSIFEKLSGKTIITASLTINTIESDDNTFLYAPNTVLLLREDKIDDFFLNYGQADKLYAFASSLSSYSNYYSFSLGYYLQKMIRQIDQDKSLSTNSDEYIEKYYKFILIPVSTLNNSSGSVLKYEQLNTPSAVKLKSGKNSTPMKIQIISMDA